MTWMYVNIGNQKMTKELEVIDEQPTELTKVETELDQDLSYVRDKQLEIIKAGHESLQTLLSVANQSQHPRAYEVLGTYLKTLSELNKDLIAISERKSFTDASVEENETTQVTNQLFVGSTAELAAMLKNLSNNG
jgi:hypothetical protein